MAIQPAALRCTPRGIGLKQERPHKNHWPVLSELRKSHFVYMGLLQTMITTAQDTSVLNNIRKFLENNDVGFEKTKANAFETAQLHIAFREKERSLNV